MSIESRFHSIQEKLQLLLKQHARLKKENRQLRRELEQVQQNEQAYLKQIEELQQQAVILKQATGQMNDEDKKDLEKMINQYLRDIEKCIVYLSQ